MADSYLERKFLDMVELYRLPIPLREVEFYEFRFDFAWPSIKVAVEIDGGTFSRYGGHALGKRYQLDCIKQNMAQLNGWIVLRADKEMIDTKMFIENVKSAIRNRVNSKMNKK